MSKQVNIGIAQEHRKEVAKELEKFLANNYVLYTKLHGFHWNVKGKYFGALHNHFEELYTEQAEAIDEIAERIQILGFEAPYSLKSFLELADIEESKEMPEAIKMVEIILEDVEKIVRDSREIAEKASDFGDEGTIDLLTGRISSFEKHAWMLRSFLA